MDVAAIKKRAQPDEEKVRRTRALAQLGVQFTKTCKTCILRVFSSGCTIVELAQLMDVSRVDIEAVLREALQGRRRTP